MIGREDAQARVMRNVKRLAARRMPTEEALGCVLARDLAAPFDLPPFDRSTMDGFAIATGDRGSEFEIIGESVAGRAYRGKVKPGSAVRVMTGAMVPAGAGQVVMKEHVEHVSRDRMRISVEDERTNIYRRGEDIRKGERLHSAGEMITPVVLANLAASGIGALSVYPKPGVGILVTGSELLKLGQRYKVGKIYNSNGPLLRSLLTSMGICDVSERMAGDSISALGRALSALLAKSDAVFVTGGVSVGEYDLVADALKKVGCKIHFDRVAVQPGKPFTFATRGKKPIFAFPGNPVSVFVSYFLYAIPALYRMMGIDYEHPVLECKFKEEFARRRTERELYLPVRFMGDGRVETVGYHGSGHLHALSLADGLMVVPVGKGEVENKERVKVLKL